jgi:hypothetical protein
MAKYLTFSFDDDNISNITIRIEEDLTKNQIDEIEDGMQSLVDQYVSNGEYWDSDEQLVFDVMNSFNYHWDFVVAEKVIMI